MLAALGLVLAMIPLQGLAVEFSAARQVTYPQNLHGSLAVRSAATADFNGDARIDLVLLTAGSSSPSPSDDALIFVYEQQHDSSMLLVHQFSYRPSGGVSYDVIGMAAADLNQDGKAEILLSDLSHNFAILERNQAGDFGVAATFDCPFRTLQTIIKDLDHDGFPDVLAYSEGMGAVVYKGNGGFQFQKPVYVLTYPALGVNLVDLDGDGREDLLTATEQSNGSVAYGTAIDQYFFDEPVRLPRAPRYSGAVTAGDFTGDGIPELIELHLEVEEPGNNTQYRYATLGIHQRGADGSYTQIKNERVLEIDGTALSSAMISEDVDRDGDDDVVVFHSGPMQVILQEAGQLGAITTLSGEGTWGDRVPGKAQVIDFNGDECLDIGLAHEYGFLIYYQLDCPASARANVNQRNPGARRLPDSLRGRTRNTQ